ncbi:hypothetical protein ACFPM7_14425 [Actinokineospora guangxiensis]|uniref:Glycosyl hydrolase family 43 n=1 Tax=Actinokineospora guangxiensis TaxID=1490288 RepID=A0ABW0ELH4_9PSEU
MNRHSGTALDVRGSTADGARVVRNADVDAAAQRWLLIRVAAAAPSYPNPGHVTGDTRVHDPTIVERPSGSVHGPGHPGVLADGDGDVLTYHWYAGDGTAYLGLNPLVCENGWPVVR